LNVRYYSLPAATIAPLEDDVVKAGVALARWRHDGDVSPLTRNERRDKRAGPDCRLGSVDGAERPKVRRKRWRILEPNEVGRVLKAFTDAQARTMFLTLILTGVRRFELLGLRWRDVSLIENTIRVRESKSEEGERLIALSPTLADALAAHYQRTAFKGDDELAFCHPKRGSSLDPTWYASEFRAALKAEGITDYVRPFHDARHASLTNGAAAGETRSLS
jgi:integrase